jgi:hypothetical protein
MRQDSDQFDAAPTPTLRAVSTLRQVLTEVGWDPKLDDQCAGFVVDFEPPYIPIAHAYAAISADTELFVFYLNFGVAAAPDRRDETAKFLTLANWNLMIGNFEMDYEDGLVRLRSSVCFRGTELSETLIRNTILFAMNAVERYAERVIDVMARGKGALEALSEANAASEESN